MCRQLFLCVIKARYQLLLVCHSSQGSALTLFHLFWLFSALTSPSCTFSCLVSAAPASTRRQLALRTRQIPADGGPRGRHAKYSKILSVSDRQQNSDGRAAEMQNTPRYFRQAIEYINTDGLDMQNTPRYSLFQTGNRILTCACTYICIYMQDTPRYLDTMAAKDMQYRLIMLIHFTFVYLYVCIVHVSHYG